VANALASVEGDTLDWRFSVTGDTRVWVKNKSGTLYELRVDASGTSQCFKTTEGGNPRRVGEGCKSSISEREIQTFLDSH
jgi:hypothetical protein